MPKKIWIVILIAILLISGGGAGIYFYRQANTTEKITQEIEKLFQARRYQDALSLCNQAETLLISQKQEKSIDFASLLLKRGKICYLLGQYHLAADYSLKAKKIFVSKHVDQGIIIANLNIGEANFQMGKYAEALPLITEALELDRRLCHLTMENLSNAQLTLAICAYHTSSWKVAEEFFSLCLPPIAKIYGDNSVEVSRVHCYLGETWLTTGNVSGAKTSFSRAISILQQQNTIDSKGLSENYWGLARTFYLEKNPRQAYEYAHKAMTFLTPEAPKYQYIKQVIGQWNVNQ